MEIGDRAQEEMRKLRDGPNSYVTIAIGEVHRLDVVYIATKRSREDVALQIRVGSRLPLFDSAIGRAILTGMSDESRDRAFRYAAAEGSEFEARARDSYAAAMTEFADKGFCSSYGDWRPDVNGIAVPVFSPNGSQVYGLNVGGPAFHVKKRQLETTYAQLLSAAAQAISIRF